MDTVLNDVAGRTCPLRYRYGPEAIAVAEEYEATTLYVVGGLYGNRPALDAIEAMAVGERSPVTLMFNGDFNWFNVDDRGFEEINRRVAGHRAIAGNVETELCSSEDGAGCGCAYPTAVDQAIVDRSNRIHARLKATASRNPVATQMFSMLPMFCAFRVGDVRVGIVHGDAHSLAGWQFDVSSLSNRDNDAEVVRSFERAGVDVFASSHTCLPVMRRYSSGSGGRVVANNGAAGMPNFRNRHCGLITRISTRPSENRLYGTVIRGVHVDALAVDYDFGSWKFEFLANWPPGSEAWMSYFDRIAHGPDHAQIDAAIDLDAT